MKHLSVIGAMAEDVRQLICRMDEATFDELGIGREKYLDAVVVRVLNHGKAISLLARTPLGANDGIESNQIGLDEWSRFKLEAEVGDQVVVRKGTFFDVVAYVWGAVTKHPDPNTRWQNVALVLTMMGVGLAFLRFRTPHSYVLFGVLALLGLVLVWRILPKW